MKIENWSKVNDTKWENDNFNSLTVMVEEDDREDVDGWAAHAADESTIHEQPMPVQEQPDYQNIAQTNTKEQAMAAARAWMMKNPDIEHAHTGEPVMEQVYRVWLNKSDASSGDRREVARYKAYTMEQVVSAVKKDLFDKVPEDLRREYGGEGTTYLQWMEIPSREETGLSEEEYKDAKEFGELGATYSYEINRDAQSSFPMNLVTGESPGRDLT